MGTSAPHQLQPLPGLPLLCLTPSFLGLPGLKTLTPGPASTTPGPKFACWVCRPLLSLEVSTHTLPPPAAPPDDAPPAPRAPSLRPLSAGRGNCGSTKGGSPSGWRGSPCWAPLPGPCPGPGRAELAPGGGWGAGGGCGGCSPPDFCWGGSLALWNCWASLPAEWQ